MKVSKLFIPFLLSVSLLGCNEPTQATSEPTVIAIEHNVENDTVLAKSTNTKANSNSTTKKNTVKKTTTPKTTPIQQTQTVNKTTVKDVIVDGTGSLVFAKADGTFLSFAPVQGQKGDKGDQGIQGERGSDGRGIDHCELDSDKNLIVYYTDGTSQNVGNLAINNEPELLDCQKVGYVLPNETNKILSITENVYVDSESNNKYGKASITISNVKVTLTKYDPDTPYNNLKYTYKVEYDCSVECDFDTSSYSYLCDLYHGNILYIQSDHFEYFNYVYLNNENNRVSYEIHSSEPSTKLTDYYSYISRLGVQ